LHVHEEYWLEKDQCFMRRHDVSKGIHCSDKKKTRIIALIACGSLDTKKELYKKAVVPTVMFRAEQWAEKVQKRIRFEVTEMKSLSIIY